MSLAVRCRGLVKKYDDVIAVDGLDLDVNVGECLGLLGPNGAGKTTTVEILEGLLSPTAGDVEILGKRWETDEPWLRQRLGVSLQQTYLPEKLTVREMLELFRGLYVEGMSVETAIELAALGEKADARYDALSGGQRQRLAVACALVGAPELLFLDEPTTGLDPQSRRLLWEVVTDFKARGGSAVLTTHYMDEAERLCDRVAVVDHGKVIALGTPQELIDKLGGDEIVELTLREGPEKDSGYSVLRDKLGALAPVVSARSQAGRVALTVKQLHVALPEILATVAAEGLALEHLSTHRATLEDVFVELTGRQLRE